jgi:hypothetical protein
MRPVFIVKTRVSGGTKADESHHYHLASVSLREAMFMKRFMLLASLSLSFVFFVAVGRASAATPDAMQVAASQEVTTTQSLTETVKIPFLDEWLSSAHADFTAEAFTHWNEEDPAEVPTNCAKCHSSEGYQDYLGADGTEANVVDNPGPS